MTDHRIANMGTLAIESISAGTVLDLVRRKGIVAMSAGAFSEDDFRGLIELFGTAVDHPFLPKSDNSLPFSTFSRNSDEVGSFIYGGAWHQNLAFLENAPDITILYAKQVTDRNNFTAFIDLCEVTPWYSDGLKRLLVVSRAIHSAEAKDSPQKVMPGFLSNDESCANLHPCMVQDEITGKEWTYLHSNYVTNLEGWHMRESAPLIDSVYRFALHDEFVMRHYWSDGNLLIWDNRRLLHRATVTHRGGRRTMWRSDRLLDWGLTASEWLAE